MQLQQREGGGEKQSREHVSNQIRHVGAAQRASTNRRGQRDNKRAKASPTVVSTARYFPQTKRGSSVLQWSFRYMLVVMWSSKGGGGVRRQPSALRKQQRKKTQHKDDASAAA